LLVNFNGRLSDRLRADTVPASGVTLGVGMGRGYYHYRTGFYTAWPLYSEPYVRSYTEGTLNIDVIDAERKQMIWEGVAMGRVTEKTLDDVKPAIDEAVRLIFANYPIKSASELQ
jgi:hypothetical protein